MRFLKREQTIQERLTAVDERLKELRHRLETKGKDLDEVKKNVAAKLADLALSESDEHRQAHIHAKKALERTQGAYDEIKLQIGFLTDERKRLEGEALRANVREAPERAEAAAKEFNALLGDALTVLTALRELHGKLQEKQTMFHSILQERQRAMAALGITEPLELKAGLGKLSQAAVPWRYTIQIPSQELLDRMVGELLHYEQKMIGWQEYVKANPDWDKQPAPQTERAGIGNVGTPGADKSFKQVWEMSQHQ